MTNSDDEDIEQAADETADPPPSPLLGRILLGVIGILLLLALHQKLLPAEQRALRTQLREAIELTAQKPAYRQAAAVTATRTNAEPPALRRAFGQGEVSRLIGEFSRVLARFEDFTQDEDALRAYLNTFSIPHEEVIAAFDAAVDNGTHRQAALLARGIQRAHLGWQARGGDYATRTPPHKLEAMTRWHTLAARDLIEVVRLSPRPTPAIVQLLGIARAYDHAALAEPLFEAALRVDPRSAALFDEYLVHLDAKWGKKTLADNIELLRRARALGLTSPMIDQTERLAAYQVEGSIAQPLAPDAPALAERYSATHDTYDAWLWRGHVERDNKRHQAALAAYERAARLAGDALEPAEQRAYLLEIMGRLDEARTAYLQLGERGSDYAQDRIIHAHIWEELGYIRDWPAIRRRCEESAGTLNRAGEFCLGGLYFDALAGYPRDNAQAVRWFRRAAERHHARAQHDFGWMLVNGMGGVTPDRAEGIYWLRQSAQNGFTMAKTKLDQLGESVEPWSHTWWRIESGFKRAVWPMLWWAVDRLPAY